MYGSVYDGSYDRTGGRYLVMKGVCRFYFFVLDVFRIKGGRPVCVRVCGYIIQRIVGGIKNRM